MLNAGAALRSVFRMGDVGHLLPQEGSPIPSDDLAVAVIDEQVAPLKISLGNADRRL